MVSGLFETFPVVLKISKWVSRGCCGNGARMGILEMLQRRKIRTTFGKYISPEATEKLLRETGSGISSPEVKHFQYVVAMADDTNPDEVPAVIGKIVQLLVEHQATVTNI